MESKKDKLSRLFEKALESAKTNKKGLLRLKTAIVTLQEFELASEIRGLENKYFPETEEIKTIKRQVNEYKGVVGMVGLKIDDQTAYLLMKATEAHKKMKGKFDLKTASEIVAKSRELFDEL